MGLSVAISGGIILTVFVLILFSLPGLADKMFSIGDITTQVTQHEQEISKTAIMVENITKNVGFQRVNFTLNNQGSTTLWDYNNFNVLVQYTGAVSGKRTEHLSYNGECLGANPPAGNWCINSISGDVADPKLLNFDEKAVIRGTVSQNLASSAVIVTVSTDNGVTFTNDGAPVRTSYIPKPTITYPKKWGQFIPMGGSPTVSTTGTYVGLLSGLSSLPGAETFVYNNTGRSLVMQSQNAAANGNIGMSMTTAQMDVFRRDQDSYLYAKWSVNERVTSDRLFIGFRSGGVAIPNNADTLLTGLNGVGICINTTSTTYQFCHNDGVGVTVWENTGVTQTTGVHYAEVYAESDANQWCVTIDGLPPICATTNIPSATQRLFFNAEAETSIAVSLIMSIYHMYVENNQ